MADPTTNQTTALSEPDWAPIDEMLDGDECPNCGGEGMVWGCFEDTCVCVDDDGLGCAPRRCDWCKGKG